MVCMLADCLSVANQLSNAYDILPCPAHWFASRLGTTIAPRGPFLQPLMQGLPLLGICRRSLVVVVAASVNLNHTPGSIPVAWTVSANVAWDTIL